MKPVIRREEIVPVLIPTSSEGQSSFASLHWRTRAKNWAGLLTRFLSFELLIQGLGFASSVLLVRALPKADYAYFTIANTMQQTMNVLADNGISSGLTAIGGRVWDDRSRFGQLLNTAMRLRRVFALVTVVVVTPILAWMLVGAGATPAYSAWLCAAVLLALYSQLTIGVLIVAPQLHLAIERVQVLNLCFSVLRLVVIAGAYLLFLNAVVAIMAAAVSFVFQECLLRRWLPRYADASAPVNANDRREILTIVKNQAPNAIYYCVQSQLAVWLISIFGNTEGIADIGALGRLGMIFIVAGSVMMNVVLPRFARVQEPRLVWRRYWQIVGVFCSVNALLVLSAAVFPEALLWILGPKYAHLEAELFLMVLNAVLGSVLGTTYQLNVTRGWIVSPWVLIPTGASTEIFLIIILDMSQVRGVLLMGILSTIPGFFLNFWRTRRGIRDAERSALTTFAQAT
ncbi:MAG TPA: hypothetical protein VK530_02380 [Candidatus Acidoferrum sp.]|nr:hypothetical protein [Candidatus Acidoferrum sp.]